MIVARAKTPPLKGRGKGWGLTVEQLAELNGRARTMRSNPTEPEKRLWRHLSNSQLGGYKFRRQAVIGNHIADFLCPQKALIVEIDGHTHQPDADHRRDAALAELGFDTLRVSNIEVMANMDGVLVHLLAVLGNLPDRWPHPNPSPEGEGLARAEPVKSAEISLEGSVG